MQAIHEYQLRHVQKTDISPISHEQKTQIKYFKNHELHQNLKSLAEKERKLTHIILLHIMEVDRRKLFLEMAYPSLWEYLVNGIGYSAPAAQSRIDAARLMVQVPELGQKLAAGSISLSQVSRLQKNIRQVQKKTPDGQRMKVSAEEKQILIEKLENKSSNETEVLLAQAFHKSLEVTEVKKLQRDESTRLEITYSSEEMEILEMARNLLSHSLLRTQSEPNFKAMFLYCAKKVIKQKTGQKV